MQEFIEKYDVIIAIGVIVLSFILFAAAFAFEKSASNGALALFYYFLLMLGIGLTVNFYMKENYIMMANAIFLVVFMLYSLSQCIKAMLFQVPKD